MKNEEVIKIILVLVIIASIAGIGIPLFLVLQDWIPTPLLAGGLVLFTLFALAFWQDRVKPREPREPAKEIAFPDRQYYYRIDDIQKGPVSVSQLSVISLPSSALIWYDGLTDWVTADQVEDLIESRKSWEDAGCLGPAIILGSRWDCMWPINCCRQMWTCGKERYYTQWLL